MVTTYSFQRINGVDLASPNSTIDSPPTALVSKADGSGAVFFTTAANAGTLYGRLLDTNGEPYGSAYTLATGVYDYGYADATVLTNGNIVVTWMGDASSTILARVYTPDLQPVSGIITVFDRTFSMEAPDIAATPDGGFVIAAGYRISSTDTDVYIKTFNGSGTPLHENWYTPGSTLDAYPSVAALTDGTIVLYWMRTINGGDPQVWRAIYSSTLGVIAAPTLYLDNAASPEVSARPDGSYLLSYSYDYYDMHSRLMGPGGALDTSFIAYRHSIDSATSSAGHTIVVMQSGYGPGASLYGQLTLPNGVIIDSASILVDGGTDWGGQSPLVEWVNPYSVELAYEQGQYQAKDGAAVARYLVIATTNGDASPNHLLGDALIDVMTGGAGNDTLDGSGGPDTMGGGSGNDLYYVDNWADLVDESSPGSDGWDTVYSWINYALPNNVEALALLGGATHGTGNAANNHLSGNAGNNVLDGSFGADTMAGGDGNDSYYVDNKGDLVDEFTSGSGWDTVYSAIDYKLGPNIEALVLTGSLKLDGIGNGLANLIVGNAVANVLKGGGGADTVRGSGGKDTIDGGAGRDIADYSDKAKAISVDLNGSKSVTVKVKGKAEDSIKNVEGIIGSIKGDKITGDSKDNVLDGHLGKDTLKGEGGKDQFVFNAVGSANTDKIADFKHNTDKIALEDWVFWSIGPKLEKAQFYAKAGATKAHDADDRIVYNKTNGNLYYDADGKGGAAAVLFATLSNKPALDHGDFIIV